MQTLAPITPASLTKGAPSHSEAMASPAAARNAEPILAVLKAHLPAQGRVLELAAGSGQHAVAFASALSGLQWTPSDPSEQARASITAWAEAANLPNLAAPLALDAADSNTWPDAAEAPFEAVVCINMIHISPWEATKGLMARAAKVLASPGGLLALYGPYIEAETPLAPSNAAFDVSLKARNSDWGLRDRDTVVAEARAHGLHLTLRVEMPANNLMLLFRRL